MKLKIVEIKSLNAPYNVVGYYLERENGNRVGQTFSNCGRSLKQAKELAEFICNAWNNK
jgi:hypothetical protein